MPFGFTHKPLVALANSAICSFFRQIDVYGAENVPEQGPIIFACTHVNMAVDPALLSCTLPHGHLVHYWVKDSLFKNKFAGAVLTNAGNIAVDRKTKNNQKLFRGTFDALALGESIGVFPEGTSHTEPHLIPLKDGTSWAALEYLRYLEGTEENKGSKEGKPAVIVPVGIAYVDKAKYRSRVAVYYGKPITMDQYADQFINGDDASRRVAVKTLTKRVHTELIQMTVNAPDWDTAFAAQMARELLWGDSLPLKDYLPVAQTLVDLFSTKTNPRITALKTTLVNYHRLLTSARLTNGALADLALPQTLNPKQALSVPTRISALFILIKDSLGCLIRLPFFVVPLVVHLPVYVVGVLGGQLAEDELETQAQTKIALSLVISFFVYPVLFVIIWSVFKPAALGAVLLAAGFYLLGNYHQKLIDDNYIGAKRLVAAWRVLIGVWWPQSLEIPLSKFLEKAKTFAPDPPKVAGLPADTKPEKYTRPPRIPSRKIVRNVLRVRVEAARDLASTLFELEEKDVQVDASYWLAEKYGGEVLQPVTSDQSLPVWEQPLPEGRRSGREVVQFLRSNGARLGENEALESHWAVSSGDEGSGRAVDE